MEFFAISGLLNGLAAIGLASFVYFRAPQNPLHWTFGLFGISTGIWSFGYFAWQISEVEAFALLNLRILMAGAIFIPITFLHHIFYLLQKENSSWKFIRWNYAIGAVFLATNFTPLFIQNVRPISIFPYWGEPGLAFHFCLIWWMGLVIYAHYLLFQAYSQEKGLRRRQLLYLLIGSSIGYLGGATNYPLWYGIEVLPYGTVGFAIYISIVAYTLLRYHWLQFSIYVEKGLAYFAVLLFVSQPVYPVLLLAQKSVLGAINLRFSLVQLLLHLLTIAGVYQMKVGTKGAVARTILKGRELRTQALSRFSSKVINLQNLQELGKAILETLGTGIGASKAAIFVLHVEENRYRALSSFGYTMEHPAIREGWSLSDYLPQMLLFSQSRVVIDDLKKPDADEEQQILAAELEKAGFETFYPIFGNNQLLGFLVFGCTSHEGVQLMGGKAVWDTIIQESALALENALLRQEVLRSQHLLCQVDRLRSLEVMADGLTQELHSPLVSIKSFVQVAHLRRHDGEFLNCLHRVVGEDLAKIEELTKEIRAYVKPLSGALQGKVHVHELIDSCLLFMASNPAYQKIMIEKAYGSDIPPVCGDRQGFMQAIFNGLLFLLKEPRQEFAILRIETRLSRQEPASGVSLVVRWKPQNGCAPSASHAMSLNEWDVERLCESNTDLSAGQGLVWAHQIMTRHSGDFHLLTNENGICGFHIQLPLHLSILSEPSIGTFPHSSSSRRHLTLTSDIGHLSS